MHFNKNQLLGSGGKIHYWTLQRQTCPSRLETARSEVPLATMAPLARPSRGRRLHEAGAQSQPLPRELGPRAPSRMGQDMTARFVH